MTLLRTVDKDEGQTLRTVTISSLAEYMMEPGTGSYFVVRDFELWSVVGLSTTGEKGTKLQIRRGDASADVAITPKQPEPAIIRIVT